MYSLSWRPVRVGSYALNFGNSDIITINVTNNAPTLNYRVFNTSFQYESIIGTPLNASDESIHTLTIAFPIYFNANASGYSKIYVSSNGTISFSNNTNPGYNNQALPTQLATTLVAVYWDDLIPSGSNSNIYAAITGSAPNRRLVVEWRNMKNYNASGSGTFQVIFYENSADIRFNYLDTNFNSTNYNSGSSATVGVQTSVGVFTQFSHNSPSIPSQFSLLFKLQ